jgi:formylglycine-generating enzyme required for sulfatase activity/serine/threonine protein kinase
LSRPQADDEIGRLGKYRVLKVLGRGGMGVVYLAEDTTLRRRVALKQMLPGLGASPSARKRFLREAQALAAVEHDHIARIYDVGEERGMPFLAMEFLKGEPLDERLKRDATLPVAEALRVGREAAEGLAAAHANGLIHRDVKPANLWLEAPRGRVKVLDFGLARATDDAQLTQSGAIVGTPAYMAPEQARGEKVDPRCDLFSLGVVLYRICTGRQPFTGTDAISTLVAIATETPTPPNLVNFEVPTELSDLIMKLLDKDRTRRFATAQEVGAAIQDIETGLAPGRYPKTAKMSREPARPNRPGAPAKPSRRRNRWLPLAAVLLFLIGGGLAGYQLLIKTPNGTLIVEVAPDAEVSFKSGELIIKDQKTGEEKYRIKASERNKTLPAGKYLVEIQSADGLKVESEKFELVKNGEAKVRVTIEKPTMANAAPDRPVVNSIGMKLAFIPPGKFTMGSSREEIDRCLTLVRNLPVAEEKRKWLIALIQSEGPDHEVEITHPFYMASTEVTVGQFRQFVKEDNYQVGADTWTKPGWDQSENHPVVWVNWKNAVAFCTWLSKKEGRKYRLPTEAEWEYCCRAGTRSRYSFGDKESDLPKCAWISANSGQKTQPVKQLAPNPWGLYDMHGSVWEWCQDLYDADYYKISPKQDPQGPAGDGLRTGRGGAWDRDLEALYCRSAFRSHWDVDLRSNSFGFRVVLEAPDGGTAGPSASQDADRKAAEWVLSIGGRIDVYGKRGEAADVIIRDRNQLVGRKLEDLQYVLNDVNTDESGLGQIRGLLSISGLHLHKWNLTAEGWKAIGSLPNIVALGLTETTLDDTFLLELRNLKRVYFLFATHTALTDGAVKTLSEFANLATLDVRGTKLTAEGVNQVAAALPGCRIVWDGGTIEPVADRKAAEWVLSVGGTIKIRHGGQETEIRDIKDLPAEYTVAAINIDGNQNVDDAGLANLRGLWRVTELRMMHCGQVGNAGMAHLKSLTGLTTLDLRNTQVGDAGLEHLKGLTNITWLGLDVTRVTNDGLVHLRALTKLERVGFQQTTVDDDGLAHLKGMTSLTGLNLHQTRVSDRGLKVLAALPDFASVLLTGTKVTADGVAALHKALPKCKIVWDGGTVEPGTAP